MGIFDALKKIMAPSGGDERTDLAKKVKAAPNDPQVRQKYATILLRQGEIVGGLSELARAAELYEKGGFASKAIAVLRQLLKYDPASLEAKRKLIGLLAQEGLSGDAQRELEKTAGQAGLFATEERKIDFLRHVAEVLPRSPLPFLLAADLFCSQRKFYEAVTELEKAAPLAGASPGTLPEFSERARALVAMSGDNPEQLEICGFLWLKAGRADEGLSILEKVAVMTRGVADAARVEEIERVLEAIRSGSAAVAGVLSFSEATRRMAEPEAPAQPAKAAPPEEARLPEGAQNEEDALMVRNAVTKLQRKVTEEIGESDHEARYNLGIAYKEMGLLDEAAEEFRISRGAPDLFLGATSLLAETLAEKGDLDSALACLEEASGRDGIGEGQARDILYQKGLLLSKAGRTEEADAIFRAIFEETPDYRDVRQRVGKLRH